MIRMRRKVKIVGIHPTPEHDIPGVRSLRQLTVTEHYKSGVADELHEVTNEDALATTFGLTLTQGGFLSKFSFLILTRVKKFRCSSYFPH